MIAVCGMEHRSDGFSAPGHIATLTSESAILLHIIPRRRGVSSKIACVNETVVEHASARHRMHHLNFGYANLTHSALHVCKTQSKNHTDDKPAKLFLRFLFMISDFRYDMIFLPFYQLTQVTKTLIFVE